MIIVTNSSNDVLATYPEGTTFSDLPAITSIPQPQSLIGKTAILVLDPSTDTLGYTYIDRALTTDEQIEQLQNLLSAANTQIGNLQSSAKFMADINQQIGDIGNSLIQLMLNMGVS